MDRNVAVLAAVQEAVAEIATTKFEQLSELELTLVGGGMADTIL